MEAKTLGAVLRRTCHQHGDKPAFLIPKEGEFEPMTYTSFFREVRRYAAAIRGLGLSRGERVGILAENCIEWAQFDWACYCLGIVSVPIYPTLPPDQVEGIVWDCGAELVVAGGAEQAAKLACLTDVRVVDLKSAEGLAGMARTSDMSEAEFEAEIDRTQPGDLATLIYTSGTTGKPKGAMMSHRAFVHVAWSASKNLPLNEHDLFLSFLPMSHVYERVAGQVLPIYLGATIALAKSIASVGNDLQKVHPTILLCVPRFLEAFRDRVLDNVGKASPIRQRLFHLAMSQGVARAKGEFAPLAPLLDRIAMRKLRERLGGRMRYFVSGGAALPPHVAEFFIGAGLTILQGYGLTETSGGSFVNRPESNRYWTVGKSLDMEAQLASDGEILLRGPALFDGYWNLPLETAAAVDREGWFHTGDIGGWEGEHLKITDRKKDILVLGNGKNVAPQPIENKLKSSPYIEEAVLFGDGMEHLIALVVPKADLLREELGLPEGVDVADHADAKRIIKREFDRINKTLAAHEMVKRHALLNRSFSIENGELTPSMKVKRRVIAERYADRLAELHRHPR
jgi:long-chain acyl-CoA synthetase